MSSPALAFVAAPNTEAEEALKRLTQRYGNAAPEKAGVIVALGGDGLMLRTLHRFMGGGVPIYGMNRGSIGFLMNAYAEDDLPERIARAKPVELNPLRMNAVDLNGTRHDGIAVNEVSLLRETRMAAKIRISIDGIVRLPELICDGVLVATPAGSSAYNLSAHGPIIPIGADLLALTPISPFRPRRWRGALLPRTATVEFEVLDADERTVSAAADFTEIRNVVRVTVREDRSRTAVLLFDPEHALEERIIREQFQP
ncbi:MAG: NAD kinase [Pseudomonadota bacterium]